MDNDSIHQYLKRLLASEEDMVYGYLANEQDSMIVEGNLRFLQ